MSPLPVLRTQLAVIGLFVRKLPTQLLWWLAITIATLVLAVIGSAAAMFALFGGALFAGPVGVVFTGILVGVGALAFQVAILGMFYRHADRSLLGGGRLADALPVWRMVKAVLFSALMVAGGVVVWQAALLALPWRLEELVGLDEETAKLIVTVAVGLLYLPLALRVILLLPLVAMDGGDVGPSWRLVLRVTRSKTVPLLFATVLQILVCVPLMAGYYYGLGHSLDFSLIYNDESIDYGELGVNWLPLLGAVAAYAMATMVTVAMQAGVIRHFFGYSNGYEEEHFKVDGSSSRSAAAEAESMAPVEQAPPAYHFDEAATQSRPTFQPPEREQLDAPKPAVAAPPPPSAAAWDFLEEEHDAKADPFAGLGASPEPAPAPEPARQPEVKPAAPAAPAPAAPAPAPAAPAGANDDPFAGMGHQPKPKPAAAPAPRERDEDDPFAGL